jgi:hypothetical protein
MKKACLLAILQFTIPAAVYAFLLWSKLPWPGNLIATLILGIFMTVSIGLIWQAIHRVQDLNLLKASRSQMPQRQDGKRVAISGRIFPYGDPLRTPFSDVECVCCNWGVYSLETTGSGKNRSTNKRYVAQGHVLTPSYIRTGMEDVRLLGFPHLEGFSNSEFYEDEENHQPWQKGAEYLQKVPLEEKKGLSDVKEAFSQIEELMTDADGSVRQEYRNIEPSALSTDSTLEEEFVPSGSEVCAMGKWSATQRGIVPEALGSGKEVILRKGSAEEVASKLSKGIISRLIFGILLAIIVNGVVWYLLRMPQLSFMNDPEAVMQSFLALSV